MIRIYLIRHGDAYDETGLQLEDYHLNNYGKIQALQLARRLQFNKFDAIYCSKIQRSMDTCEIVNEIHKKEVIYWSAFNEVGSVDWPQPGVAARDTVLVSFKDASTKIAKTFKHLIKESIKLEHGQVAVFTHGNWIRVLLCNILAGGNPHAFAHLMIHNTSLTIIDVDEALYEHIVTISDAAHTQLFKTVI